MPRQHQLLVLLVVTLGMWGKVCEGKVCQGIDIRNSPLGFRKLEGCTVIEGSLRIVLMDNTLESDFENMVFPELREVVNYVLFYRVRGLLSIRQLFPNLRVIRGQSLVLNYALVISQMHQMRDVSLANLTILRGGVAIVKNKVMSYADTVNWDRIADSGEIYISSNKPGLCAACPNCPSGFCWNQTLCQENGTLNGGCDEECVGGCKGPGPANCTACKHLLFDGVCVRRCPPHRFEYLKWACLTEEECLKLNNRSQNKNKAVNQSISKEWFTYNGICMQVCPSGRERDMLDGCSKVCSSIKVDSIQAAQYLRGCTFINGSLEIQITSGRPDIVAKELEENLGTIEEISGYLKIHRSFPLINLKFLRNLKAIHGEIEPNKPPFSFIVLENQNLQELWDWNGREFKIHKGRVYFHFNPKLCLKHINKMAMIAGLGNLTNFEAAKESNGGKFACNPINVTVKVNNRTHNSLVLKIEPPDHSSYSLHRFIVYYMETEKNMTAYDETSECGENGWKMNDVNSPTESEEGTGVFHVLTHLKPYTQYAYFVSTYTVGSTGGQTPVHYVRTRPSRPTNPLGFQATPESSSSLLLNWEPPHRPNGRLEYYLVTLVPEEMDLSFHSARNYCTHPMQGVSGTTTPSPRFKTKVAKKVKRECSCEDKALCENTKHQSTSSGKNVHQSMEKRLEDLLDNRVIKGWVPKMGVLENTSFTFRVEANSSTLQVRDLKHYTDYLLEVRACRANAKSEEEGEAVRCSHSAVLMARTLPDPKADLIEEDSVRLTTANRSARISWDPPPSPNGFIHSYQVEHRRTDVENSKASLDCLRGGLDHLSFELRELHPGKYSLRLRAVTSAGPAPFTAPKSFVVEGHSSSDHTVLFMSLATFCLLLSVSTYCILRRQGHRLESSLLVASVNPEYSSAAAYTEDEWELRREDVEITRELKQGNFGMVYEGYLAREGKRCAVKTSKREDPEFLAEARVMKSFKGAHYVVALLGVVTRGEPILVVMELLELGDLKTFLRRSRDSGLFPPPHEARLLLMAAQIADGMAFLETRKFVHRDLAARNCMVSENLTVKIGDFGMTRDVYETDYYRKGNKGLLPIRWMAPESLNDGVFTSQSDVWSYGIVVWEMATLGSQPYQGLSNEQVLQYIVSGNKLDLPEDCPRPLVSILCHCWRWKPRLRPTFLALLSHLEPHVDAEFRQLSFFHSEEGLHARQPPSPPPS